jgi:membrane-associated phospholipid phosphatase
MSRIGLGKHYVSDVLGGWACGIAIAQSSYPLVSPQGWLRTALASVFTLEVLYIAASAQRRSEILGWPFLALIVVLFWITFPFAA